MTRPWVPWCGYSALPLQSVFKLSIAASLVMAQVRSRVHYRVLVEMEDKPEIIKLTSCQPVRFILATILCDKFKILVICKNTHFMNSYTF